MYFEITTTKDTATGIEKQFKFLNKVNKTPSYVIDKVTHYKEYSVVRVKPKTDQIKPDELFFLGLFVGINSK